MSDLYVRACSTHPNRKACPESPEKGGRRRSWRRVGMGSRRRNGDTMPKVRSPKGILLSDADAVCGRADDHLLQVLELRSSMERKLEHSLFGKRFPRILRASLICLTFAALAAVFSSGTVLGNTQAVLFARAQDNGPRPFKIVLFMCVWKRPILTDFVLRHYGSMKPQLLSDHNVDLEIFITGSDNSSTPQVASRHKAGYAVHPNRPLGTKHNLGLRSLRQHFLDRSGTEQLPDAVAIVGSDDILNRKFFVNVKKRMTRRVGRMHIVGLQDIYFFDLDSLRLMYTAGYRKFLTPIAGTVGCGRAFSWAMLDTLNWVLWDWERNRSLDQSSIRRILKLLPQVGEVSMAITGRGHGIVAVDVKTDSLEQGTNIWSFDEIVKAVGKNGPLHEFQEQRAQSVLDNAFDEGFFLDQVLQLRKKMEQMEDTE